MRITRLLLSLSFLFHSVCSNDDNSSVTNTQAGGSGSQTGTTKPTTSATAGGTTVLTQAGGSGSQTGTTKPTTSATAGGTTVLTQAGDAGNNGDLTKVSTTTMPITVVAVAANTVTTTHKPTDKLTTNHAQEATGTSNSPDQPARSHHQITNPVTTADTGGFSVTISFTAATSQMTEASVSSKTSQTEAPGNVGTTTNTKVSTESPTAGQPSMTSTSVSSKTGQANHEFPGTQGTTVTNHNQSPSPEPAGSSGATSPPSALTTESSGTKAGTTSPQTTSTTATPLQKTFMYSLNSGNENEEEKDLVEVCRRLMSNMQDGNCTLMWGQHSGKIQFDGVEITGKVKASLAAQYYEEITKKPTDKKTLIAILASCAALLIMIIILAVCASHHRKPYSENQQHLTEELHTVEKGYHDNPTLEVMEVQPEMQEKKTALNGEFNDNWIVPIDNLLKEGMPDEEDTHL